MTAAGRLTFENDRHLRTIFEALNEQRKCARFCDAILKAGEREITGHRSILAAAIPKILENHISNGESEFTIDLEGLDPNAVEVLVEFAYTGKLNVPAEGVLTVFHAAKSLGIREVQDLAEQFIREKVLPLDWMAVRAFAEMNDCPNLMSAVDEFIEQNVEEIYHKKDFFQLPRLQIELAATNDRQKETIDSEKLCKVAISWAHKQLEVRKIILSYLQGLSFTCRFSTALHHLCLSCIWPLPSSAVLAKK